AASCILVLVYLGFFFFQAEDGIRVYHVTGVQTCALPISVMPIAFIKGVTMTEPRMPVCTTKTAARAGSPPTVSASAMAIGAVTRSEERRVGKECGSRGVASQVTRS